MTNPSQLFFQILCQGSVCIGGSTGTPPEKAFYLATRFLLAVLISNSAQVQSKPAVADKPERSAVQTGSLASNLPQTEMSEPQIKAELGSSISPACQSQSPFPTASCGMWVVGCWLSAQTCRFSPLAWARCYPIIH